LFKGRAAILADSQNGDIIVLSVGITEKQGNFHPKEKHFYLLDSVASHFAFNITKYGLCKLETKCLMIFHVF
jgi:hypothetical protein